MSRWAPHLQPIPLALALAAHGVAAAAAADAAAAAVAQCGRLPVRSRSAAQQARSLPHRID
eukprot:5739102-Prymnesium_polylepis.1